MSDLISRQEVVDIINRVKLNESYCDAYSVGFNDGLDLVANELSLLLSAQSEREEGEWLMLPDPYGFFDEIPVCSECGCTTKMREKYKYCPNCGAYMKERQEE